MDRRKSTNIDISFCFSHIFFVSLQKNIDIEIEYEETDLNHLFMWRDYGCPCTEGSLTQCEIVGKDH